MKRTDNNYIANYLDRFNYSKKEYRDTLEQVTVSDNMSYQSIQNENKLNVLKESIKTSARQMKKDKGTDSLLIPSIDTHKSEKERLIEYYQSLKNNSKLNLSKDNFNMITSIEKKPCFTASLESNEFIIYDCFKSMLKNNKRTDKSIPDVCLEKANVPNFNNINPIEHKTDHNDTSIINELKNIGTSTSDCQRSHCIYYKKKYKFYKDNYEAVKIKLKKEKKITEMLNLKLFYESNKHLLNQTTDRSEKLNSTNATHTETKLTKDLYEKLEENVVFFEKLGNEILNKNTIIEKQNETIHHQKDTIDKLLNQISTFLGDTSVGRNKTDNIYQINIDRLFEVSEQTKKEVDEYNKDTDLTMSFSLTKSNNKIVDKSAIPRQDEFTNSHVFDMTNTILTDKQGQTYVDHEIQDILNNN
jgi:hypothetical protein